MSQTQKEKTVIALESAPVLEDLGFTDLVKKFKKLQVEESVADVEVAKIHKKRMATGAEIAAAIEVVQADSVDFTSGKFSYRATLVKGEAGSATDEDKLKLNLMKMAKLDAGVIEKIFAASQVPVAARKPYVLVTAQE